MKEQSIKTFTRLTKDFEERQNHPTRKVVHAICDSRDGKILECFYESEHQEFFPKFLELLKTNGSIELLGAWLRLPKEDSTAKETWEFNESYLFEHHGNLLTWHDKYQDWMI
ncbi:hypothetical protein [Vibrio vulnificus]|uniref:hypothetical protein n=1 Tax=Vibrio vulnificus TaxID=672 RepID=UPI003242C50D